MSFLSTLFRAPSRAFERQTHELYTLMLTRLGWAEREADDAVTEAIRICKRQGKRDATWRLPPTFGEMIIVAAAAGEPKSLRIVEKARRDGATDEDIKRWWNMPDLSRRMMIYFETMLRYSVFKGWLEEGLSSGDAARRVHNAFPTYGDPDDTTKLTGPDRPLPFELRDRINIYKERMGAGYIAEQVARFSSYNAFVRWAIAHGEI